MPSAIRKATLADVDCLLAMGASMIDEAPHLMGLTPDVVKQRKVMSAAVSHDDSLVIIAGEADGMFIGHIGGLYWFSDKVAFEDLLFVRKEKRRNGIGIALVDYFLGWCEEKGADAIQASVNTGVLTTETEELYKTRHFERTGVMLRRVL